MAKRAFEEVVAWCKAHPKFATCAACVLVGVALGLLL